MLYEVITGVEAFKKGNNRDGGLRLKMGDHPKRVHTGIRPSGAMESYWFLAEMREPIFQRLLDGRLSLALPLPAAVVAPIIGDQQADNP